jgi:phenylalanyl-tRNA synthetase beta chain
MGGERGKCQPHTRSILVETAAFEPRSISQTGQRTNIASQARMRFERGVDPASIQPALKGLVEFLGLSGQYASPRPLTKRPPTVVALSLPALEKKIGVHLETQNFGSQEIERRLTSLGCTVKARPGTDILDISPPSWRHDLNIPEDFMEEALRLNGYQDVPCQQIFCPPSLTPLPALQSRSWKARRFCSENGFLEVVTWSFFSQGQGEKFWDGPREVLKALTLLNPISTEFSVMRTSILPHLLDLAVWHKNRGLPFDPVFEIGPVFFGSQPGEQKEVLAGFVPLERRASWCQTGEVSFWDVKSILQNLLQNWGLEEAAFTAAGPSWMHPGQSAQLWIDGQWVGYMGRLHPRLAYKCDGWCFELDMGACPASQPKAIPSGDLQPLAKDLSFFWTLGKPVGPFLSDLKAACPDVVDMTLMDLFQPKDGVPSIAVRCVFQPVEKSFSDEEMHQKLDQIIQWAKDQGVELKGQWP